MKYSGRNDERSPLNWQTEGLKVCGQIKFFGEPEWAVIEDSQFTLSPLISGDRDLAKGLGSASPWNPNRKGNTAWRCIAIAA